MIRQAVVFHALLFISGQNFSQTIESSITRSAVLLGETFELTVSVERQSMLQKTHAPDFRPLERDFEILENTKIENESGLIDEYWLTLLSKRRGQLTIPELELGNIASNTLAISVLTDEQSASSPRQELILELSVDKSEVAVQEELKLTLRLLYLIQGIGSPQFTEITIENAEVEPAILSQYVETIHETRYGVYQLVFTVIPKKSGGLRIPDVLFRGQVVSAGQFFAPNSRNDERVSAFTEGLTVSVIE